MARFKQEEHSTHPQTISPTQCPLFHPFFRHIWLLSLAYVLNFSSSLATSPPKNTSNHLQAPNHCLSSPLFSQQPMTTNNIVYHPPKDFQNQPYSNNHTFFPIQQNNSLQQITPPKSNQNGCPIVLPQNPLLPPPPTYLPYATSHLGPLPSTSSQLLTSSQPTSSQLPIPPITPLQGRGLSSFPHDQHFIAPPKPSYPFLQTQQPQLNNPLLASTPLDYTQEELLIEAAKIIIQKQQMQEKRSSLYPTTTPNLSPNQSNHSSQAFPVPQVEQTKQQPTPVQKPLLQENTEQQTPSENASSLHHSTHSNHSSSSSKQSIHQIIHHIDTQDWDKEDLQKMMKKLTEKIDNLPSSTKQPNTSSKNGKRRNRRNKQVIPLVPSSMPPFSHTNNSTKPPTHPSQPFTELHDRTKQQGTPLSTSSNAFFRYNTRDSRPSSYPSIPPMPRRPKETKNIPNRKQPSVPPFNQHHQTVNTQKPIPLQSSQKKNPPSKPAPSHQKKKKQKPPIFPYYKNPPLSSPPSSQDQKNLPKKKKKQKPPVSPYHKNSPDTSLLLAQENKNTQLEQKDDSLSEENNTHPTFASIHQQENPTCHKAKKVVKSKRNKKKQQKSIKKNHSKNKDMMLKNKHSSTVQPKRVTFSFEEIKSQFPCTLDTYTIKLAIAEKIYHLKELSSCISNQATLDQVHFYAFLSLLKEVFSTMSQYNGKEGKKLFEAYLLPFFHDWLKKYLVEQEKQRYKEIASHLIDITNHIALAHEEHLFILYSTLIAHHLIQKFLPGLQEKKASEESDLIPLSLLKHRDINGNNLLLIAQRHAHIEVTKWLIEKHHIDPFPRDRKGKNILQYALQNKEIRKKILPYQNKQRPKAPSKQLTPSFKQELKQIIEQSDHDALKNYLQKTDKPGLELAWERFTLISKNKTIVKLPLLHFAMLHLDTKKPDLIHTLLAYCTQQALFIRDQKGNTIIHSCILHNRAELLVIYSDLCKKIDFNSYNKDGKTALHYICLNMQEIPGYLFVLPKKQPNVYALDKLGNIPFIYACQKNAPLLIDFFLCHGVQPNRSYGGKECAFTLCLAHKLFGPLYTIVKKTMTKKHYYITQKAKKVHIAFELLTYYTPKEQGYVDFMKYLWVNNKVDLQEENAQGVTLAKSAEQLGYQAILDVFKKPKTSIPRQYNPSSPSSSFKSPPQDFKEIGKDIIDPSEQSTPKETSHLIKQKINKGVNALASSPPLFIHSFSKIFQEQKMKHIRMIIQYARFDIIGLKTSFQESQQDPSPMFNKDPEDYVHALIFLVYLVKPYVPDQLLNLWETKLKQQSIHVISEIAPKIKSKAYTFCSLYEQTPPQWPKRKDNMVYLICAANDCFPILTYLHEKRHLDHHQQDDLGQNTLFFVKDQKVLDYCIKRMKLDPVSHNAKGDDVIVSWSKNSKERPYQEAQKDLCLLPYINTLYKRSSTHKHKTRQDIKDLLKKTLESHSIDLFMQHMKHFNINAQELLQIAHELAKQKQVYLLNQLITPKGIKAYLYLLKNKLLFPLYRDEGGLFQNCLHKLAKQFLDPKYIEKLITTYPQLDINSRDTEGNSLLFYYVEQLIKKEVNEKIGISYLNRLIQLGLSPYITNAKIETIYFLCIRKGTNTSLGLLKYFKEQHKLNLYTQNKKGEMPLLMINKITNKKFSHYFSSTLFRDFSA